MTKQELTKIQNLYIKSIELLEIDVDSSLLLSRKILETLIHRYFEYKGITKKAPRAKYPILSNMIKKLYSKEIITDEIFNSMEFIRKKGNDGAHVSDKTAIKKTIHPVNPSIAKGSIKRVGTIIIWFLDNLEFDVNSLYLQALSLSKINKNHFAHNEEIIELSNMISTLCNTNLFNNPNKISDTALSINTSIIYDTELNELIQQIDKFCRKYINFHNNYVYNPSTQDQIKNWFGIKVKSSTKAFLEIYQEEYKYLQSWRKMMADRYII